ncbi:hypothetical protein [Pseudomonas syringae]|uniref:hypothetical protein n=1 Tax=Pseudomonas syringae TaxID=317 RepID=UPI0021564DB5|nr:hypothetical protein [Pseudomonas syringae]MDF7796616.1 hypothetical protein [Pseudomonas syringae]
MLAPDSRDDLIGGYVYAGMTVALYRTAVNFSQLGRGERCGAARRLWADEEIMVSKKIKISLIFLIVVIGVFVGSVNNLKYRQASSFVVSETGEYLIENVSARGLLVPFGDLAYLRITDKRDSNAVFRSPLYSSSSLDMSSHEDEVIVGIVWLDFYKRDQRFVIRFPEWESNWLSFFISNTPYEVVGE